MSRAGLAELAGSADGFGGTPGRVASFRSFSRFFCWRGRVRPRAFDVVEFK